jgi:hypothetical protein
VSVKPAFSCGYCNGNHVFFILLEPAVR